MTNPNFELIKWFWERKMIPPTPPFGGVPCEAPSKKGPREGFIYLAHCDLSMRRGREN
jgi:hypothetical protein